MHFLLQLALVSLCACCLFFHAHLLTALLFITLGCSLFANKHLYWRIFFLCGVFITILFIHPHPIGLLNENQIEGIFTPSKASEDQKHGYIRLEGTLLVEQNSKSYFAPFWISLPRYKALFPQYQISGTIKSLEPLRLQKASQKIHPLSSNHSICFYRFEVHRKIQEWIVERCSPFLREGRLLSALFIGTKPDDNTKKSFAKNGLQHVLAISGLHFGLIATIFSALLYWVTHAKLKKILLLVLLSFYFILLCPSPSILRAYIASSSYLLATCFNRKLLPLNALGLGVLLGCYIDPMSEMTLSFELSFLATFAILLLFKPLSRTFSPTLKLKKNLFQRCLGKLHLAMIHNFCLTLAASSMTIPLLLSTFHQFPLLSVYWNLFIPYLIGLAMTLFAFCALFSPLLTFLSGNLIHGCCRGLKKILDILEEPRSQGELLLSFPSPLMISVIFFFAFAGIFVFKNNDLKN